MVDRKYKEKKLNKSVNELKTHIENLEKIHGSFCYAPELSRADMTQPFVYLEKLKGKNCFFNRLESFIQFLVFIFSHHPSPIKISERRCEDSLDSCIFHFYDKGPFLFCNFELLDFTLESWHRVVLFPQYI